MPGQLTRVFSDLHYGDRATRVGRLAQLRPLCEGVQHLVLNGDTLDTRPGPFPAHTAACRAEVLAFFPREVPQVTFLTGNHDPDFSPHHRLELAGGQVFVTHGDIVFDDVVPWSRDAATMHRGIVAGLAALSASEREDLDHRLAVWRRVTATIPQRHQSERRALKYTLSYFADTLWPPTRVLKILEAWRVEPAAVAALVRPRFPGAKFILTGHLHRTSIWREMGAVAINTGSFCPPFGGSVVDLLPGRLVVRRIEKGGGEFHPGKIVADFPLENA